MSRTSYHRWLLAILVVGLVIPAVRSDLIFLKDGYVIQGTVRRQTTAEYDPISKDVTLIPKGFFMVDDGPRRVYFSPQQVRIVEKLPAPTEERFVRKNPRYVGNPRPMPGILEVVEEQEWDLSKWERKFTVRSKDASRVGLIQAPLVISPYYFGMVAVTKFNWYATYLTREFEPETVHKLLLAHPLYKEDPKSKATEIVTRRLRLADFFAQAAMYDLADKELDRLLKEIPESIARVTSARKLVDKLRVRDRWEQIKNWYQAGRFEAVRKNLETFPNNNVTDQQKIDLREMQEKIDHQRELITGARTALEALIKAVNTPTGRSLASAAAVILTELHPSNIERLDAFLGQYRDAERQRARGKIPLQKPEELLSLAITGWLLGSPSSEALPEAAINLWKTRQMVIEYLGEPDRGSRMKVLAEYETKITPQVGLDEIAQLIRNLPPAMPALKPPTETTEIKVGRAPISCWLKLPPEYTHNRAYPLLIVLHHAEEKPARMLARWEKLAAEHGYILAAPEWVRGLDNQYGYTEREHDTVLETIRDLKKRYRVDCDRIFLAGQGEGGTMALDVGLAHPDYFAGVLPMNPNVERFPRRYWRNAQYLPFYIVSGTRAGETYAQIREHFTHWVDRGFPALWVEYKGRGTEFFRGELPLMFDWMRHQNRHFPIRQLGIDGSGTEFGTEFCTMREEDNRFYWLGTNSISSRRLVSPERWNNLAQPAAMTARILPATNEIYITTQGLSQVTVWLGRNSAGATQIDFDRPLTIRVGLRAYWINRKVKPSLAVLMEDLYQRGDRTQLYLAKIDISLR